MTKFKMYDSVRVLLSPASFDPSVSSPEPQAGDIGIVMMIYDSPNEAYGVEESSGDGRAEWLADFEPSELELAAVAAGRS